MKYIKIGVVVGALAAMSFAFTNCGGFQISSGLSKALLGPRENVDHSSETSGTVGRIPEISATTTSDVAKFVGPRELRAGDVLRFDCGALPVADGGGDSTGLSKTQSAAFQGSIRA